MKTLVVYDNTGQLIFTQTNATDSYECLAEDVAEDREPIGIDLSAGKLVTVNGDMSEYNKSKLIEELQKKNEYYNTLQELEKTKAENVELNTELKKEIDDLNTKIKNIQLSIVELDSEDE